MICVPLRTEPFGSCLPLCMDTIVTLPMGPLPKESRCRRRPAVQEGHVRDATHHGVQWENHRRPFMPGDHAFVITDELVLPHTPAGKKIGRVGLTPTRCWKSPVKHHILHDTSCPFDGVSPV